MQEKSDSVKNPLETLEEKLNQSHLDPINHQIIEGSGVNLWIKRDDQIHPIISGNKWRKLKYILKHALDTGHDHLISMGGPWSNHLHALAWVGKELGLETTGIIRGEIPDKKSSTLKDIEKWGMQLEHVNRLEFRQLRAYREPDSPPARRYQGYWIPEGGATQLALKGVSELVDEIHISFDVIVLACGTGTTLAGIASALPTNKHVVGFSALKGAGFLYKEVNRVLESELKNWSINLDYHFGGFAKADQKLFSFMKDFEEQTGILLDPVYTGKMMYGLFDLIRQGHFQPGTKIMAIHTGGLQGSSGFMN